MAALLSFLHRLPEGATVLDLVSSLGRDPRTVAVERNGELLPRASYAATRLLAGDRLEVVHFVQGGSGKGASPPHRSVPAKCNRCAGGSREMPGTAVRPEEASDGGLSEVSSVVSRQLH